VPSPNNFYADCRIFNNFPVWDFRKIKYWIPIACRRIVLHNTNQTCGKHTSETALGHSEDKPSGSRISETGDREMRNTSNRLSRFLEEGFPCFGIEPRIPKWARNYDHDGNLVIYNWLGLDE